jgi:hypothetical protein
MDDAAKKKYMDLADKDKERYEKELAAVGGKKPAKKDKKEDVSRKVKPTSKDESKKPF